MAEEILTKDSILDAAQEVLRRYGLAKTTVVDVARSLGVSHGSIYRHYASKAELREAVVERWLHRVSEPLAAIAEERHPPEKHLRLWFDKLIQLKRHKVLADPELFAVYHALAQQADGAVQRHVAELLRQLTGILAAGIESGAFTASDARKSARALLEATSRFHHPVHAGEWGAKDIDQTFQGVWDLLIKGLKYRR